MKNSGLLINKLNPNGVPLQIIKLKEAMLCSNLQSKEPHVPSGEIWYSTAQSLKRGGTSILLKENRFVQCAVQKSSILFLRPFFMHNSTILCFIILNL